MLFNSLPFCVFFIVVFFLYYLLPQRFRWVMLLVASYYFYASWNPELLVLIVGTTLVTYFCGRAIGKDACSQNKKKLFLWIGIGIPLLTLFFFKYFNFFGDTMNGLFQAISLPMHIRTLDIILPVGISFYTFQTLSYVIDVYRGEQAVEPHLGIYALYVSFFPQLVAGPIERSGNLLPQFYETHTFQYENVARGLKTMAWGFFKKIVVADTLAIYVDTIYHSVTEYTGLSLIIATVFFTIQIYCDFSGYSDIAIGAAQMMGFRLMKNFNSPYFSTSIKEFWKRWHISLSTWFMDYVYIPLGGNRVKLPRYYLNLFITFLVSGLWHGANWTFVLWGALHGIYMVIGRMTSGARKKLYAALHIRENGTAATLWKTLITFVLVCVAWVLFRANTLQDALHVFQHAFDGITSPWNYLILAKTDLSITVAAAGKILFSLVILTLYDCYSIKHDPLTRIDSLPFVPRWLVYYGIVIVILLLGQFGTSQFIYFQF